MLGIRRLGSFGVGEPDLPTLVGDARGGSMRGNPVELTDRQLEEALRAAL